MRIVVDHISGARAGQRQEFRAVPRLEIGRHPENDIAFDSHEDLDASTRHAELRRQGRGLVLCDVGSANGTFVGGVRVTEVEIQQDAPVLAEFGEGGPVLHIWFGADETPPPDPALYAGSPARGEAAPGILFKLFYECSWRFRLLLLLGLAVIVGALALVL